MIIGDIQDILTKEVISEGNEYDERNKFDRLREAIERLALEIEKNKIEVEGLITNKIVWQKPEEDLK